MCVNGGRVRRQAEARMFGGQEPTQGGGGGGEAAIAALYNGIANQLHVPRHPHPHTPTVNLLRTHEHTPQPPCHGLWRAARHQRTAQTLYRQHNTITITIAITTHALHNSGHNNTTTGYAHHA